MRSLSSEVCSRLRNGRSLAGLPIEVRDGRFVVDTLSMATKSSTEGLTVGRILFHLGSPNVLKRVEWKNLHCIGCDFSGIAFLGNCFTNCVFEKCVFDEAGFWEFRMSKCTFMRCDLRRAALGGVDVLAAVKNPNTFEQVKFEKCDMRHSAHSCEIYSLCGFHRCKLDGVLFMGAVFEDCEFSGRLRAVELRRYDGQPSGCRPNELLRCDFRKAELIDCQFLNIDLDPATFPESEDWIVLRNGPADLIKWQLCIDKDDWYIQRLISLSGAPTILSHSGLVSAGFSSEEIAALLAISGET